MKETTIVVVLAMVGSTVLLAMGKITANDWMIVNSVGVGGKSLQGTAQYLPWPNKTPSTLTDVKPGS
jgi:hypothetical protein